MSKRLDEFLVFLAVEKGASSNTIAAYKNDLQQLADFIGSHGNSRTWQKLVRSDIQDFILNLKDRGYTETSVARKVAAVRSFFGFLAAEGDRRQPHGGPVLPPRRQEPPQGDKPQ
jgi:integrase/recombinase XerD